MPCSHRGVLKTRAPPNSSFSPIEQRKTPPKATSSPKTIAVSSALKAHRIASFTAVKRFIFLRGPAMAASDAAFDSGAAAVERTRRFIVF
jgi:hypothetical protein